MADRHPVGQAELMRGRAERVGPQMTMGPSRGEVERERADHGCKAAVDRAGRHVAAAAVGVAAAGVRISVGRGVVLAFGVAAVGRTDRGSSPSRAGRGAKWRVGRRIGRDAEGVLDKLVEQCSTQLVVGARWGVAPAVFFSSSQAYVVGGGWWVVGGGGLVASGWCGCACWLSLAVRTMFSRLALWCLRARRRGRKDLRGGVS